MVVMKSYRKMMILKWEGRLEFENSFAEKQLVINECLQFLCNSIKSAQYKYFIV